MMALDDRYQGAWEAMRRARSGPDESDLQPPSGGDTSPPVSNGENLKGRVDLLQTLVIAFIAGLLALAAGIVAAVTGTNARIDAVQSTSSSLNRETGEIKAGVAESNRRLERIERQLDIIANKTK